MKNLSLTINPNAITSLAPPVYVPPFAPGSPPPAPAPIPKQVHSVSIAAQFDEEDEAANFASYMLSKINEFKGIIKNA